MPSSRMVAGSISATAKSGLPRIATGSTLLARDGRPVLAMKAFEKVYKGKWHWRLEGAKETARHDLARAGRTAEALEILDMLESQADAGPGASAALAHVSLGLGREQEALDHLEQAWDERSIILVWLKVHPAYDPLRSHPRFQALLRRMNFPD